MPPATELPDVDPTVVQTMDSVAHIPEIQRVGRASAERHVMTRDHLRGFV